MEVAQWWSHKTSAAARRYTRRSVPHFDSRQLQLRDYITNGGRATMIALFEQRKAGQVQGLPEMPESSATAARPKKRPRNDPKPAPAAAEQPDEEPAVLLGSDQQIVVVPSQCRESLLCELEPRVIVLLDAHPRMVRMVETYNATLSEESSLRVYSLLYERSVEKQQYLSLLRSEKSSFEKLIETKATMLVPENQSGKTLIHQAALAVADATTSTRSGGDKNQPQQVCDVALAAFELNLAGCG